MCDSATNIHDSGSFTAGKYITAKGDITADGGYLYSTLNGNTVQIGSQNGSYAHFTNTKDIPFWFNKVIQSDGGFTIYNTGDNHWRNGYIKINNSGGGDCYVELRRAANTDWRMLNSGGHLYFQSNWTSAKGSYYNVLQLEYNSGNINVLRGNISISHATSADMAHSSTNPKITFSESGGQPVHLIYTDYDSYRSPAGLKVVGGASASPAWFEVEGQVYAAGFHGSLTGNVTGNCSGSSGSCTGHAASDLALSGGNMTGKIYSSATRILQWTTSDTDNNADGASWYGLGKFTPSGDNAWICLSNYWGISFRARDTDHVKINGNVVLNAGNYTSYTVTKTGSGASGSWGISVTGSSASCTGNAATATKATQDADGYDIRNRYFRVYNTGYLGNSSTVTVNDLANQGPAYGMINAATDNPSGGANWVHVLNMGWGKTNASWIGQIALSTSGNWIKFRGSSGAISGVAWKTCCDLESAQNFTGTKSWGASGAGGQLNGGATNGGINSIRVGDDVWLGDCNAGGIMGMKSTGANCGFYMYNSSGTQIGQLYFNGTNLYCNRTIEHPDASVSYIAGAKGSGAALYAKKTYNANHWYPAVALETKGGGAWQIGNYDDETLEFQYATKANRDANTNSTSEIYMQQGDTGRVLTSGNYTNWTVTKTGSGASGTWGINVTGTAGGVAWDHVSSKPATATRWPSWSEVTSKPAVQNNLTSTSTTDMLSAAQGKALNDNKTAKGTGLAYTTLLNQTYAGTSYKTITVSNISSYNALHFACYFPNFWRGSMLIPISDFKSNQVTIFFMINGSTPEYANFKYISDTSIQISTDNGHSLVFRIWGAKTS